MSSESASAGAAPVRRRSHQSVGIDELSGSITGWNQIYDQLSPGKFTGALTEIVVGPMQLFLEKSSHALAQTCQTWPDAVWFGIPVDGRRAGRIEGAAIEPGMLAVRTGHHDFQLTTPDDFGFLGVVVKTEFLERHLDAAETKFTATLLGDTRVLRAPEIELERFKRRLHVLLQADATELQAIGPNACDMLVDETLADLVSLLRVEPCKRDSPSTQNARRLLRRTREYLLQHSNECVTVHALCREFGSSRRAFQDCFTRHMGVSPKAYLRAFGLNAARRELVRGDSACRTVSDVATRFGFWHLSQFAADYRRLFHELPSETLRRRCAD